MMEDRYSQLHRAIDSCEYVEYVKVPVYLWAQVKAALAAAAVDAADLAGRRAYDREYAAYSLGPQRLADVLSMAQGIEDLTTD